MADWTSSPNMGTIKTLNYATVLASPTRTPRDAGYNFTGKPNWLGVLINGNTTVNDRPFPCNWEGGNGWIGVFSGIGNTSNRMLEQTQDGRAFFGVLTYYVTDKLDVTLNANIGFLDTKFTNIKSGAAIKTSTEFARAPETTYSLSAQYEWTLTGGASLVGRYQANYWDEYWRASTIELRPDFQGLRSGPDAGDLWMHNARLTYTPADGNYEISL